MRRPLRLRLESFLQLLRNNDGCCEDPSRVNGKTYTRIRRFQPVPGGTGYSCGSVLGIVDPHVKHSSLFLTVSGPPRTLKDCQFYGFHGRWRGRRRPAVDAVATGECRMIHSMMPDSREPVPSSSGFAITRRGGPRNVAATEEQPESNAAESKPSKTRCGSACAQSCQGHH